MVTYMQSSVRNLIVITCTEQIWSLLYGEWYREKRPDKSLWHSIHHQSYWQGGKI